MVILQNNRHSSRLKKPRNQLGNFVGIMVPRILKSGRIRQDLDVAESLGLRMAGTRYVTRAELSYEYDSRFIFVFLCNMVL